MIDVIMVKVLVLDLKDRLVAGYVCHTEDSKNIIQYRQHIMAVWKGGVCLK